MLVSKGLLTPLPKRIATHYVLSQSEKHSQSARFPKENGYFAHVFGSQGQIFSCKQACMRNLHLGTLVPYNNNFSTVKLLKLLLQMFML